MIKNYQRPMMLLVLMSLLTLSLQSCFKDECTAVQTFTQWTPQFKKADEIRIAIKAEGPRALKNPGKLYFYNNYIIVNEIEEGVHIIDNSDQRSPQNIAFIPIPGNVDMAAKGNRLYVDNYMDLLTLNIENPKQPVLLSRTKKVFTSYWEDHRRGFLVGYLPTQVTREIDCTDPRFGRTWFRGFETEIFVADDVNLSNTSAPSSNAPTVNGAGVGGSFARFTIVDELLYTVDQSKLYIFDLANSDKPNNVSSVNVGWGIETIFPYKDKLFLGANRGLFIFDNSDPLNPTQMSVFAHANACDPVYVVGDLAYVTLRDGTRCEGYDNQLDVIDVADLNNPELLYSYPMDNPHGLSIDENTLLLCEGAFGLKSFDISDISKIDKKRLDWEKNLDAYDVITLANKTALVIGKDGLYQYDISNPKKLKQISVLPVERN